MMAMNRNKKRTGGLKTSLIIAAFILVMLSTLTLNGTFAFLFETTETVENSFEAPETPLSVYETVNGNVKSDVSIRNDGNVSCYIRATLIAIWRNADGTGTGLTAVEGTDYTVSLGSGWTLGSDGYYYYSEVVNPQKNTSDLYNAVTVMKPNDDTIKADKTLEIQIIASSIQARGWPDSVYASQNPAQAAFEAAQAQNMGGEGENHPATF